VALDGSRSEAEQLPPVLAERLALHVDLRELRPEAIHPAPLDAVAIETARSRITRIDVPHAGLQALCATAQACGVDSMRVPLLALRVARASAALAGRAQVAEADLEAAARLVIAPRARIDPGAAAEAQAQPEQALPEPASQRSGSQDSGADEKGSAGDHIADQVLAAARAAIPTQLLASLGAETTALRRSGASGRSGAMVLHGRRGRPAGVRAGKPRMGARLNLLATLRCAAPWQRLRRAQQAQHAARVLVRVDDLRVTHFRQRSETATIFVLDASGSSALHRLAEIKGAVEVLLAECYVRRDQVAVISFRSKGAELLLPPTRSLVRAKRLLAGMPGGGATPLASGIDAARELAEQLRRRGLTPSLVLLTDGQANVGRDGSTGRERAQLDALRAAKLLGACQFKMLLIDTSPRPQAAARSLAESMRCRYLPLPYADARTLASAVRSAQ
jgi:magnesium chelatase subunit D